MTRERTPPPRIARRLISLLIPRDLRDEFLDDLEELYAARESGARLWYWRQLARLLWPPTLIGLYRATSASDASFNWDVVLADMRFAIRRTWRRAAFSAVAIVSLALGIGANTAAFSLVDAILFRHTPLARPDRVADVYVARNGDVNGPLSYPDYLDLKRYGHGVIKQISISKFSVASRDAGDHVEPLTTELVNGDYFPLLGLRPTLGRLLGPEDDRAAGAHPVIVLSYDYWHSAFDGDVDVVGKQIRLSGMLYTIVGVAPKTLQGLLPGLAPSIYASVQMVNEIEPTLEDELAKRGTHSFFARVRLEDGKTMASLDAVAARMSADMHRTDPSDWPASDALTVRPLASIHVNPLFDPVVIPAAGALMVVVALVLIVACANLASVLLAQARDRRQEMAIRLAIGASRRALVRQLLIESLVLALGGGVLGIVLSTIALRAVLNADLPIPIPINLDVSVNRAVLAFALVASTIAGVLFGLAPALRATRPDIAGIIKGGADVMRRRRRLSLRDGLVVSQVALCLVLLVTAGLFLRSFVAQASVKPGFGDAPAGMVWMAIPPRRYPGTRAHLMLDEIERRTRALPNVDHVGVINNLMLNTLNRSSELVNVAGFQPPKGARGFEISDASADSGFFDAAGVQIVSGRVFRSTDTPSSPRVAVVNEEFVKRFWPGRAAIGQTFTGGDGREYTVVGVSRTTKVNSLGEAPQPFMFVSIIQSPTADFNLIASTRGSAERTVMTMLAALHKLDPGLLIVQAKTMQRHLAAMVLPARLGAAAFAVFSILALTLAVLGVYGVVRYAVTRRRREVAIRLAVGAAPRKLVRLLMREGFVLVLTGTLIGIALSLVVTQALRGLLYGVGALDPLSLAAAPAVLIVTGVIATYLPARRAARIDPASTLRGE